MLFCFNNYTQWLGTAAGFGREHAGARHKHRKNISNARRRRQRLMMGIGYAIRINLRNFSCHDSKYN